MYYSVCASKCPNNGTADADWSYLPNTNYPAGSYELANWNVDTDKVMGFCIPDLDYAEDFAEIMYE